MRSSLVSLDSPRRSQQSVAWLATVLTACLLAVFVIVPSPANAQEKLGKAPGSNAGGVGTVTQPVAIATIGSVNQLSQDINYLTGALGQPQLGAGFAMMAGMYTQGIDTSQPIGLIVPLIDGSPEPIVMLPAADVKSVLKRLEPQTGPADELDDGTLVIAIGANTVFIRQVGTWAVLARNRTVLDHAPADPTTYIAQLGSDYDLAVKLDMQQIPASVRNGLIGQLRQGFDQAMSKRGDDAEAARQYAEQSMEQLEQIISQTDDVLLGLDIDSAGRRVLVDATFTALPGTQLAKIYGGQQPIPSAFSMVIREDAAGYFHGAASVGPETAAQARKSVTNALRMASQALGQADDLTEEEQAQAKEIIERIAELALSSYEEGKMDMGALLLMDESKLQFVAGCFVADGKEAAGIVKEVASKLESRTDSVVFEFDRDTYKGVTMHLAKVAIPEKQDELRKIFGAEGRIHIGTAAKAIYLGLGDASLPLMMEMVDASAQTQPAANETFQMQGNLMPILNFAQSIENNDSVASMIDALSRADDGGTLRVITKPVNDGQTTRIVLGDGLLQAIGAAIRQAQAARFQNQF